MMFEKSNNFSDKVVVQHKNGLLDTLTDLDLFCTLKNISELEIYLLGGSAAILGDYIQRATRDFDILNLDYSCKIGVLLKFRAHLESFRSDFCD